MAKQLENATKIEVKTQPELRSWLEANHLQKEGVWLVRYKKNSQYYLPTQAIVQECLCFGWIDSLPRKLDETRPIAAFFPWRNIEHCSSFI